MSLLTEQLIRRAGDLAPMPAAAQKALTLLRSSDSDIAELARVISVDQVLTGMVLRYANSAYYGMSNQVATVQKAILVLGMTTLHNLILSSSFASYLNRPVPGYGMERGDLWRHSVGVATGAQMLLMPYGRDMADEAYHVGLLCDVGKLAMEALLLNANSTSEDWQAGTFDEMEVSHFGVDHAALGAEMARRWRLPENLVQAIACHHRPQNAGGSVLLASAVHVADATMMMLGMGIGKDGLQYRFEAAAVECLGIQESDLVKLFENITNQVEKIESFIGLGSMKGS